jgi:hypothetical protein
MHLAFRAHHDLTRAARRERAMACRRAASRAAPARARSTRLRLALCVALAFAGAVNAVPDALLASPLSDCGGSVNILRSAAWPGGGAQLTFAVGWGSRAPLASASLLAPTLPTVKINGVVAVVTHAPQKDGVTGVLIVPAPGQLDAQCTATQALVESLPQAERVGIWYLTPTGDVALAADFTNRRAARRTPAMPLCAPSLTRHPCDAFLLLRAASGMLSIDWWSCMRRWVSLWQLPTPQLRRQAQTRCWSSLRGLTASGRDPSVATWSSLRARAFSPRPLPSAW